MLMKVGLALVAVVVALSGVVAMQPSNYRVVRSITISAPPEKVFGLVDDFHKWETWSPWAKIDPNMKETYAGPAAGQGAIYSWEGNNDVGKGRMTILESRPNERVRLNLEFLEPFASTALTEFEFKSGAEGTRVDWAMSGENNFVSKAFCLFTGGMDKMIGPDFQRGLAQMKRVAEGAK